MWNSPAGMTNRGDSDSSLPCPAKQSFSYTGKICFILRDDRPSRLSASTCRRAGGDTAPLRKVTDRPARSRGQNAIRCGEYRKNPRKTATSRGSKGAIRSQTTLRKSQVSRAVSRNLRAVLRLPVRCPNRASPAMSRGDSSAGSSCPVAAIASWSAGSGRPAGAFLPGRGCGRLS